MSANTSGLNLIENLNQTLKKSQPATPSFKENKEETSIFNNNGTTNKINDLSKIIKDNNNFYIYGENEKIDYALKQCSNTASADYDLETDAKETTKLLKELIYSDDLFRNSKVMDLIKNNLDPANIDIVLKEYETLTNGRSLQEDINIILTYNPIKKHNANKIFDSLLNFKNKNSKVKNKYWQGDEHSVIREGSIITITNKKTNQTRQIDLAILLKNFNTSKEREELIKTLQKLPGEVLMDIAIEQTTLIAKDDTAKNLGYYDSGKDQVALKSDSSIRTIVHEFGHSIDYNDSYGNNVSYVKNCNTFMEIFNEEIEKFIANGNDINQPGADATKNEREMFAACYTLLMTGDCSNRETLEKYFPRTLGYAKQLLEHIRGFSDSKRH